MTKEEAIQSVEKYLKEKEFSWEAMYHTDKEPEEYSRYWLFKNLWEPRDPRRGDDILVDSRRPYLLVHKIETSVIEVSYEQVTNYTD
ncbi:MAG: hypothetical protein GY810_03965 [Aureispira sp.]|nr:hypothetical protein [Aureispira sp.]